MSQKILKKFLTSSIKMLMIDFPEEIFPIPEETSYLNRVENHLPCLRCNVILYHISIFLSHRWHRNDFCGSEEAENNFVFLRNEVV